MLPHNNNLNLSALKIDPKYFYFIQLWNEFTDKKTFDTYQFRLINTLSILEEIKEATERYLREEYKTVHNILHCREEALSLIQEDLLLDKYYKNIKVCLLNSFTNLDYKSSAGLKTLIYHMQYALKLLRESYLNNLLIELEVEINSYNKKNIRFYTNQLLSILIDRQWSVIGLSQIIKILYNSVNKTEKWEKFSTILQTDDLQNYVAYFPLKLNKTKDENFYSEIKNFLTDDTLQVCIISREDLLEENTLFENKSEKEFNYIKIIVQAHDYFNAALQAVKKYSNLFNALSFYNLIYPWSLNSLSFIIQREGEVKIHQVKPYQLCSTYDFFEDSKRFYEISKKILKANCKLKDKLLATYSYTNMGKATYSQEEKFMNLWVALESLCKTDMYSDIIGNIIENVPPAMCHNYIFELVNNFVEDCCRCGVDYNFEEKKIDIKSKDKNYLVTNTIEILNNNDLYANLLEKCKLNDLLYERCKEMHTLITNSDELISRINKHFNNVKLQLSRLYRIRNEIAHTAMDSNKYIIRYVEHLLDYLTTFTCIVLDYATDKQMDSLPQILSIIKDNYFAFLNIAKNKNKEVRDPLLSNLLSIGKIDLI